MKIANNDMSPELERFIGNRVVRRVVVETALSTTGVFSADQLLALTRTRHREIGRATIYRTLRRLCERKLFREIFLRNGVRVYQRADDDTPSLLWVCDDCSTVRSLPAYDALDPLYEVGEKNGFYPAEATVEIHSRCARMQRNGTCPGCGPSADDRSREIQLT